MNVFRKTLYIFFFFFMLFLQVNTLKLALEGVEKERDYYFSKLREVELLCQEQGEENAAFIERLMEILYSSDEQVGPQVELSPFSQACGVLVIVVKSCVVQPEKDFFYLWSHMLLVWFLEVFIPHLSIYDIQEGAELAEGNGEEEVEQQTQEEGGDDQQEEQDEY